MRVYKTRDSDSTWIVEVIVTSKVWLQSISYNQIFNISHVRRESEPNFWIAVEVTWWGFDWILLGLLYAHRTLKYQPAVHIPKFPNVVKNVLTDSSNYCCYWSFNFWDARHVFTIHLIIQEFPEKYCSGITAGDHAGRSVGPYPPITDFRNISSPLKQKVRVIWWQDSACRKAAFYESCWASGGT